jgi:hypothetical protein
MFTVTVRSGAKVRKQRFDELGSALTAMEHIATELSEGAHARPAGGVLVRRLAPVQQVVGRIELSGPARLRAGIDVRGDGSTEAYTGRLRREVVEQRRRESTIDALRRAIS